MIDDAPIDDATALDPQQAQNPQDPQGPAAQTKPPTKADLRRQLSDAVTSTLESEAQGAVNPVKQQLREQLARAAHVAAFNKSQEAQGLAEHLKYLGLGVGKAALDGTAHLSSLAYRLSGLLNPVVGPEKGMEVNKQVLRQLTGSEDPGIMDILGAMKGEKSATLYDPVTQTARTMSIGEATDEFLRRKIGNYAVGANVAGTLMSFMGGPGAWLGQGSTKVVAPLAGIIERGAAKSLMRGAGMAEESVRAMLQEGRAMEVLAKLPEWKQTLSLYDSVLMNGGRHVRDLMTIGAGNMAQSYGLLPDDQRFEAAKLGLITAPLAMGLVRGAQHVGEQVLTLGLDPERMSEVANIYQRFTEGKIGAQATAKLLDETVGKGRRFGADAVAGAFEGLMFPLTTDPALLGKFTKWLGGDQEAGADLATTMLASMAGVVGHRFGTQFASKANQVLFRGKPIEPMDHHLFRLVTPDLNRLNTRIQAEAIKQAAAEAKKAPQSPQEPQAPTPKTDGLVTDPKKAVELERQFRNKQAGDAVAKIGVEQAHTDNVNRQWEEMGAPDEPFTEHLQRTEAELMTRWSWADHLTLGVMRATQTEPSLEADGSVGFQFGPDFSFDLKQGPDGPVVSFDPSKMLPAMKDAGRKVEGYDPISPAYAEVRGDAAVRFLDDVTLVQMMHTMQGDLDFTRLGLQAVNGDPSFWGAPTGGGTIYARQMDGSTVAREKLGGFLKEHPNFLIADGFDQPKYEGSRTADLLTVALQNKHALAPDNVIDGVIGRAIMLARHSDSPGAEQLRDFFAKADPQEILSMLNSKEDQILAFQLGSLAVASNNAPHALAELQRMRQAELSRQKDAEASIAEDLAAAEPPMPQDDFRAKLEGKPTRAERDAMASPEQQTERARQRMEDADHTVVRPRPYEEGREEGDYSVPKGVFGEDVSMKPGEQGRPAEGDNLGRPAEIDEGFGTGVRVPRGSARTAEGETVRMQSQPSPEQGFGEGVPRFPERSSFSDLLEPDGARSKIQEGFGEGVPLDDLPRRGKDDGDEEQRIIYAMSGFDIRKLIPEKARKEAKRVAVKFFQALTERYPELLRGRGDDEFVDTIRRVNARKGENVGEAQALEKKAKKLIKGLPKQIRKDFFKVIETDGGSMTLGQAIAEGRKFDIGRPITDAEKSAAAMWRSPMEATRAQVAKGGGVREVFNEELGTTMPEPIREGGPFRTPRMPGDDWAEVMNDRPQRLELWKDILEHPKNSNLQIRDPETGERRMMTPEELDDIMLADVQAAAVDVPGRQAAVEFKRQIEWFPGEWRGKKLLETNLEEILRRVPQQQAGRAATLEAFGPDVSPEGRKYLQEYYPEWAAKHLTDARPGVEARLKQAAERFVKQAPSGEGPQAAQIARNIITNIEGRIPKDWQYHGPLGVAGRAIHAIDQPIRSAITSLSFTADPGDAVANSGILYSRPWQTLKLLANLVLHPIQTRQGIRDAFIEARRSGLIVDAIGQNDMLEGRTWRTKWSDFVQFIGSKVENSKIAYFTSRADAMLADWREGYVTGNDRRVVSRFLRFSAPDQRALLAGTADPKLQAAFRREFVQFAVSRRPIGEGSAFSAHPGVRAALRFTNWSSGNLFKVARIYRTAMEEVGGGFKEGNWKQFWGGIGLGLKASGLLTGAGLISKLLSYSIAGVLRGEGADGWDRFWKEMAAGVSDPSVGAKILRDTFGTQVLGGPAAFMLNAFSRADDPGFWAKMTTPGALYYALQKTLSQNNPVSHPLEFAMTLPVEMGYVPFGSQLKQSVMASAALAGADPRTREIMRRSWEWETLQGISKPKFERTKPAEFYDALANVRHAIEQHPDDIGAALRQSGESLKKALNIGGEESVAASLRGYQFIPRVPKEKLDSFADYIGDEGMNYVYAHDQAIREFARVLGFAHGDDPTPLDRELESAQRHARLGGRQLWRPIADRVLDDAEVRLAAGQGFGEDLLQAAESMAAFPEQQDWLSDRQKRAVSRPGLSYSGRVRLLESIMKQRARARSDERRKSVRSLRQRGIVPK